MYDRHGPPEVLHLAELPKPVSRDGEVLVRVHATTVSVPDYRCRSFTVPRTLWIPARLALGGLTTDKTIATGEHPPAIVEAHRYVDLGHKKGNVVVMITG